MRRLPSIVVRTVLVLAALGISIWAALLLPPVRRAVISALSKPYAPVAAAGDGRPVFDGTDVPRKRLDVRWVKVADGLQAPTDLQFVPGTSDLLLVAQKGGAALWLRLGTSRRGPLFALDVPTESELGLLGLACHPRFADNGKLYVHANALAGGKLLSRITEWVVTRNEQGDPSGATEVRTILQVEQPYQNHNGGQLAFGPDGMLYIGFGDGGFRDDPHNHGQDRSSWLGKMLRIDVDATSAGKPYAVPRDNPFVGQRDVLPEAWAIGLRNPWRYSFDARGRLIVADVGQDKWEEISIVERGDNLGWSVREGRTCFRDAQCNHAGMKDPIYVYGRDDGQSITGGFVYTASDIPALTGKYVFADFVRGRFWAIPLPEDARASVAEAELLALGRFALLPSAFARDPQGRLYVADFGGGAVMQLLPGDRKASL